MNGAMIRLITVCLLCMGTVMLSATADAAPWSELSKSQQRLLRNYESGWADLPAEQQERLALGSQRWLDMDADQRQVVRDRFQRWQNLSPEQRERLQQRLADFRSLSPEQQQRVRSRLETLQQMTPEQRQRVVTPPQVYPKQESVIGVHWHPEGPHQRAPGDSAMALKDCCRIRIRRS